MAENTLVENVTQAIEDFKSIKGMMEMMGFSIPVNISTSEYQYFMQCLPYTQFENGIAKIKSGAFSKGRKPECHYFALKQLPDTITTIGSSAFFNNFYMALTKLPRCLKTIGSTSLYGCKKLKLINLPENVVSIESRAFAYCDSLKYITFNSTPETIASNAFEGCSNLTDIFVPWSEGEVANAPWGAENATIHYLNFYNGMTQIENGRFVSYIKATINNNTYYGNEAYYHLSLTALPNTIVNIGEAAFYRCGNLDITYLPKSVAKIGISAFNQCYNLRSITFNSTPELIAPEIFSNCQNLTDIFVPWSEEDSKGEPWWATNATVHHLNFYEGITEIPDYAFCARKITSNGVTYGDESYKKLALMTLPDTITSIGAWAFMSCENLILDELPKEITKIGGYAFSDCPNLAINSIPKNTDSIEYTAFQNCYGLTTITFDGTPNFIASTAFSGCLNLTDIFVPWSKDTVYGAPWGAENATVHYLNLYEGVTEIPNYAFSAGGYISGGDSSISMSPIQGDECFKNLHLKKLPDSIITIGHYAFLRNINLNIPNIPDSVTFIGNGAFAYCNNLNITKLPDSIEIIRQDTFNSCENLALTKLPDNLIEIRSFAFDRCKKITITSIPKGVTEIGSYAFYGCDGITTLTFKGTPTSVSSYAFSNCTNLTDIYVPWSEGEVEGAPWGATNATIHYNHTSES